MDVVTSFNELHNISCTLHVEHALRGEFANVLSGRLGKKTHWEGGRLAVTHYHLNDVPSRQFPSLHVH